MIIAVDFDGTIVEHRYPEIGPLTPCSLEVLGALQGRGDKLILWTIRSGPELREAVDFCAKWGLHFWGVNENPDQKYWSGSPKAYANIFIDDAALGCPLIIPPTDRPYVDWVKVREELGL